MERSDFMRKSMFLILVLVMAAVLFAGCTTTPPNCGNVYCKPPNQCCNNICYGPCNPGSFIGDDCTCHSSGSFKCGNTYCPPNGECCRGLCYGPTPPGFIRLDDCSIIQIGMELCNGQYYKPCPGGFFRAENCGCTPVGAWLCNGVYYAQCPPGSFPFYPDCSCRR